MKRGDEVQQIQLEPLPEAGGSYSGHLTLILRNSTKTSISPDVVYLQDGGSQTDPLDPDSGGPAEIKGLSKIVLPPGVATPLQLAFELPSNRPASWLDGTLVFTSESSKANPKASSLVVPVAAEFESLSGLTFSPSSLAIQVTRGRPGPEPSAEVELSGTGAKALLDRKPPFSTHVLLGNDDGHRVDADFEDVREEDGEIRATVSLSDEAAPGEYKGSLVFGEGKDAPALALTVKSHIWVLWFILLVFFSALLGGLLPKLSKIARRRAAMRLALGEAIKRYEEERPGDGPLQKLPWDLDRRMGRKPWLQQRWSPLPDAEGYSGLYAQLRWARSEEELDDLGQKVTEAVEDISHWSYLHKVACELDELDRQRPPGRDKSWAETQLAQDTANLLRILRTEPPKTMDEVGKLELRCSEQIVWHRNVVDAWTKITEAQKDEARPEEARKALAALDFKDVVDATAEADRKGSEMTKLTAALIALAARARKADDKLPPLLIDERGGGKAQMKVQQEAALVANEGLERTVSMPSEGADAEHTLKAIRLGDWAVTLLIALGSVVLYIAPLYDSTWGSLEDLLVAAAAGFGTQLAIEWAALPLFQSIRYTKAAETKPKEGGGSSGDDKSPEKGKPQVAGEAVAEETGKPQQAEKPPQPGVKPPVSGEPAGEDEAN
ncbi:MAG TPA: hypothetical protein VFJ61_06060 [Solirubrobacterales bacterium]|nr:hypothetical protein [Solirubrobacterales bacterium]